jgi:hypothetical protein
MPQKLNTMKRRAAKALSNLTRSDRKASRPPFLRSSSGSPCPPPRKACNIVKVRSKGHLIKFRTPTARALCRAETLLTKEPATIRWIDSFDKTTIYCDIGANVRIYGLYAANVKGRLFNHALLCDNIRLNGLEGRVAAYALA